MKAKELRIGNWVQDEFGIVQYVYRIWKGGAELSSDESGSDDIDCSEDEIFGIPLIEEWLLKFRFKKLGYGYDFWESSVYNIGYINGLWYVYYKSDTLCNIQYVHQLQNLYFALTQKELTL